MTNEAAEQLREILRGWVDDGIITPGIRIAADAGLGEALATERRLTVERVRERLDADDWYGNYKTPRGRLNRILDDISQEGTP